QGFLPPFKHFATSAIHVGQDPEQWRSGAVVPPISLSTTFKQRGPGEHAPYVYTRFGNTSRHILEEVVGSLDGAGGEGQDWANLAAADGAKYCE
ncbi:CGL lyase, partial [Erithacus rubecula]|nr:CGL lyase [Erithacus rubecula]